MKVPLHVVNARRAKLQQLLSQQQYMPIAEVCDRLGVSEATARRDLVALEGQQTVTRTHGGAFVEYNQRFPSFRERLSVGLGAKKRIGDAAAALVQPGQVVWLDGGTTGFAIAQALAARPAGEVAGVTVVTNNLPAAECLAEQDHLAVHLLGGQYFRRSSLLVGKHTLRALEAWTFDLALLGAEGLDAQGLWNSVADVVAMQKAVMRSARRCVFCVDAAKVGHRGPEHLLPLSKVGQLLTDAPASALQRARIALPAKRLLSA